MMAELERLRRKEHRTRSELVREALRQYMQRGDAEGGDAERVKQRVLELRDEKPSAEEILSIGLGTEELAAGQFATLEQLRHDLGRRRQRSRAKKSPPRPRR